MTGFFERKESLFDWLEKTRKSGKTVFRSLPLSKVKSVLSHCGLYPALIEVVCAFLNPECATEEELEDCGAHVPDLRSALRALFIDFDYKTGGHFVKAVRCHVIGRENWLQFLLEAKHRNKDLLSNALRGKRKIPVSLLKVALPQTEEEMTEYLRIRVKGDTLLGFASIVDCKRGGDYWRVPTLKALCPKGVFEELLLTRTKGCLPFHLITCYFLQHNATENADFGKLLRPLLPVAANTAELLHKLRIGKSNISCKLWFADLLSVCKPQPRIEALTVFEQVFQQSFFAPNQ